MSAPIYFKGSRFEARQQVYRLRAMLVGKEPDPQGIALGFTACLGFGALSDIKDAYLTKAQFGTDEMGVSWKPLSKKYLAYGRRFGIGEQAALKKGAGLGKGNRFAPGGNKGLLDAQQLKRWREVFASTLHRLLLSLASPDAASRAAAIAWQVVKSEGGQTKLEVYGNRVVEILRDTGVLFNSLSPGYLSNIGPDPHYSKPGGKGGNQQIFETRPGAVVVGTNVPYAHVHDKGSAKMPRRQILPDDNSQIPEAWWDRWLKIGELALAEGARLLFEGRN